MVMYPIALDSTGDVVQATRAQPGTVYSCLLCGARMFRRTGPQGAEHFYHRDEGVCTGSETELHKVAKKIIVAAMDAARQGGSTYSAIARCEDCGDAIQRNDFGGETVTAVDEIRLPGTRRIPDVSFIEDGKTIAIVEIDVTNPLTPDKIAEYRTLDIPVFVVKPDRYSIWDLWKGIRTKRGVNIGLPCRWCAARQIREELYSPAEPNSIPKPTPTRLPPRTRERYVPPPKQRRTSDPSRPPGVFWTPTPEHPPEPVRPPSRQEQAGNAVRDFIAASWIDAALKREALKAKARRRRRWKYRR